MTFEVLPAIDLAGGRLARLEDGEVRAVDAFDGDPLAAAASFVRAGARWLHVVDIDRAFERGSNRDAIAAICECGARVQVSGGLTRATEIDEALGTGAARAVVGGGALADRPRVERLIAAFPGEALAFGIETEGEVIRPRGGGAEWELPLRETVGWLAAAGASRFVVTAVGRVSSLGGPDLEGARALGAVTSLPCIVSGGVGSLRDLSALAALSPPVEGAVVGRALYDGALDPAAAIAAREA